MKRNAIGPGDEPPQVRNQNAAGQLPADMSPALHQKIAEFRNRAELCEQYAREASDELMREQFLTTANSWRRLAAEAEQLLSRAPASNARLE